MESAEFLPLLSREAHLKPQLAVVIAGNQHVIRVDLAPGLEPHGDSQGPDRKRTGRSNGHRHLHWSGTLGICSVHQATLGLEVRPVKDIGRSWITMWISPPERNQPDIGMTLGEDTP